MSNPPGQGPVSQGQYRFVAQYSQAQIPPQYKPGLEVVPAARAGSYYHTPPHISRAPQSPSRPGPVGTSYQYNLQQSDHTNPQLNVQYQHYMQPIQQPLHYAQASSPLPPLPPSQSFGVPPNRHLHSAHTGMYQSSHPPAGPRVGHSPTSSSLSHTSKSGTTADSSTSNGDQSTIPLSASDNRDYVMTPDPPPGFFRLEVLQQPRFARACGSGDKDRRQVDPPPVIKLHFGPEALPGDKNPAMHYILLCELTDESGTVNVTNRSGIESELVGNRTVQSYNFAGRDPPLDGTFFAFPDLSVRSVGRYRLNFKLIRLPQLAPQEGDLALQPTSVHTDIFQVYPAKDFPGMLESTELTKALAEAGMPISLKKGHERRESEREKDGDR